MLTKNYAKTREEVEKMVNEVLIPGFDTSDPELVRRVNVLCFLYSCSRISALEVYARLIALYLGCEDTKLNELFKEDK